MPAENFRVYQRLPRLASLVFLAAEATVQSGEAPEEVGGCSHDSVVGRDGGWLLRKDYRSQRHFRIVAIRLDLCFL